MNLFNILLIPFGGVWDRFRGDDLFGFHYRGESIKTADAFIYACIIGYQAYGFDKIHIDFWILNFNIYTMIAMAPFLISAIAMSYKNPWGAVTGERELKPGRGWSWWEKLLPFTQKNKHVGLFVRALIGAAVMAVFCIPTRTYGPMIGVYLGFQIAPYISIYWWDHGRVPDWMQKHLGMDARWPTAEFIRGCIVAGVSIV